jgi:hypothetical protein
MVLLLLLLLHGVKVVASLLRLHPGVVRALGGAPGHPHRQARSGRQLRVVGQMMHVLGRRLVAWSSEPLLLLHHSLLLMVLVLLVVRLLEVGVTVCQLSLHHG